MRPANRRARLIKIAEAHTPREGDKTCAECGKWHPCPTWIWAEEPTHVFDDDPFHLRGDT